MTLGEYIKKYREEHDNMSYHAFANLVGLSPQYVINLENGINNNPDFCEKWRKNE